MTYVKIERLEVHTSSKQLSDSSALDFRVGQGGLKRSVRTATTISTLRALHLSASGASSSTEVRTCCSETKRYTLLKQNERSTYHTGVHKTCLGTAESDGQLVRCEIMELCKKKLDELEE